jgi:hypothetical protein
MSHHNLAIISIIGEKNLLLYNVNMALQSKSIRLEQKTRPWWYQEHLGEGCFPALITSSSPFSFPGAMTLHNLGANFQS